LYIFTKLRTINLLQQAGDRIAATSGKACLLLATYDCNIARIFNSTVLVQQKEYCFIVEESCEQTLNCRNDVEMKRE
jgi:hypothetical protein